MTQPHDNRPQHMQQAQARPRPGPERLPAMRLQENGLYEIGNQADLLRVAKVLLETQAMPKSFRNEQQVSVAVQALMSLGLNPLVSARQTGFIRGAFTIFGDLPMALVRMTGQLESFEEFTFTMGDGGQAYLRQCFDNGNCHIEAFGAVCRVQRKGLGIHEVVFTLAHAERAGLWKEGRRSDEPWQKYTSRMLMMRARSQALKDVFADVLSGVQIKEYDVDGVVEVQQDDQPPRPPAQERRPPQALPPKQQPSPSAAQMSAAQAAAEEAMTAARAKVQEETGADIVGLVPQAKRPGINVGTRKA